MILLDCGGIFLFLTSGRAWILVHCLSLPDAGTISRSRIPVAPVTTAVCILGNFDYNGLKKNIPNYFKMVNSLILRIGKIW
jgi:hypothetical protein